MTNSRPLSLWLSEEEIEELKRKSKKDKRSVSNFCRIKLFDNEK